MIELISYELGCWAPNTNNRAETVLDMFIDAILEHGIPSRVHGDRGGENRDVSILMILLRGLNRASFMWGPSVFTVLYTPPQALISSDQR
jgi:hypothetical protein